MKRRIFTPLFLSVATGGIIMALVLYRFGYSAVQDGAGYRVLSDAMTVPAVILIGAGVLILCSRGGVFDIFSYALTRLVGIFAPFAARTDERFYDFKTRKHRADFLNGILPLCVGVFFLFLALIFLCLFYAY